MTETLILAAVLVPCLIIAIVFHEVAHGWVALALGDTTARDQGRTAARGMLGDEAHYARGTWYNSAKLMDIEYTTAGLVNFDLEGEKNWFHEETGGVRSTSRIVTQGDRVIGFNMLGRRWDHSVFIEWIEERRTLDWVLKHLNEAAFDTEFVPPLRVPRS